MKGSMKKVDDKWIAIQKRTFTAWVNDKLRGDKIVPDKPILDMQADFQNGLRLIELLDVLAKPRKVTRYSKNPKNRMQCLENLGAALSFIKSEGIKLVNISKLKLHSL